MSSASLTLKTAEVCFPFLFFPKAIICLTFLQSEAHPRMFALLSFEAGYTMPHHFATFYFEVGDLDPSTLKLTKACCYTTLSSNLLPT
jgi:hypothetical protein